MKSDIDKDLAPRLDWIARIAVGAVFAMNVWCALDFIVNPGAYAPAYELTGVAGQAAVQGLWVAFLMWNVTYPLVIARPSTHLTLYAVVLAQQVVGLVGETVISLSLPSGHTTLAAALERFIVCDGAGLLVMALAFVLVRRAVRGRTR